MIIPYALYVLITFLIEGAIIIGIVILINIIHVKKFTASWKRNLLISVISFGFPYLFLQVVKVMPEDPLGFWIMPFLPLVLASYMLFFIVGPISLIAGIIEALKLPIKWLTYVLLAIFIIIILLALNWNSLPIH